MTEDPNKYQSTTWTKMAPWFLTLSSLIVLILIGDFLLSNIDWFKEEVFAITEAENGAYRQRAFDLHLSMIKRSVGLFSGFAIMFIGLGVSFFSLKNNSTVNAKSGSVWSVSLVTASPGIIAICIGGVLIMHSISSKDDFGAYTSPNVKILYDGSSHENEPNLDSIADYSVK